MSLLGGLGELDPVGSLKKHMALFGALVQVLADKGILTDEDLARIRDRIFPQMLAQVDQELAKQKAEAKAAFAEESPVWASLLDAIEKAP